MKRREFIKSSLVATSLTGLATEIEAAEGGAGGGPAPREYYELRQYHLRRGPKQKLFDDYFRDAALPALNRIGVKPVGVFNVLIGPESPTCYVLLAHPTADSLLTATDRMRADAEYQKAGADFINATAADPAYARVESALLLSFSGLPRLEVPAAVADGKPRIYELRTYESHSKTANKTKISMFNDSEIAIFRRCGLQPVFFAETLIGGRQPSLTYLLSFESLAAREKNWAIFAADPEWKKLSATPGFTDAEIVSSISNVILRPAPYSQI